MNTLTIEWKHFDKKGNTCLRCTDTGEALNVVVAKLAGECRPCGWEILFTETKLTEKELPLSNSIFFNGRAIEDVLPKAVASQNHCSSCCELTNSSTSCRTVEFAGTLYEAIPAALIRQAACIIAQCCSH